ncbi:MAG: hypothetical protein Ta2A_18540 [Treponemataceae bacterium]|nr:MAG: hypothetical protein Ta2A_18540 [Treponemataceae bacterium]
MAYSSNGINWTAITPGTDNGTTSTFGSSGVSSGIYCIAYGGGKFVAGGWDGQMAYSSNGTSWTAVGTSPFGSGHILGIVYGGGKFVAVGANGKIAYSN